MIPRPDMKIIDRYVFGSLLVTFLLAVSVLTVVLVLGNIFRQLVNRDAPIEYILTFIAYILPFSLTFTVPWGFLTAVLLVFGKMSAENELIALRATGVSIPRVSVIVFFSAMTCVGVCLWINVQVAPKAQAQMKDALYNIATKNPLSLFRSDKIIDEFPGQKIYIERNEGAKLYNLLIYQLDKNEQPVKVIAAHNGWLEPDLEHEQLLLHVYDGRYEQRDDHEPEDLSKIRQGITMEESTLPISLRELYEKSKKRRGFPLMSIPEILKRVKDQDPNKTPKERAMERSAGLTEVNKRFSYALASFAFALIGIPLAITAHRRETSIGFLMSMIVAFVYFMFILVADSMRNNAAVHPHLLIWTPNILFIGIGSVLFFRLSRR